jgi:hypothetical protein
MSFFKIASAATGLLLVPFGQVNDLVRTHNPWHGFSAQDPVLWVVRAQEFSTPDCREKVQDLVKTPMPDSVGALATEDGMAKAWKSWGPWEEDDLSAVSECDDFPCEVKLNGPEVKALKGVVSELRQKKYFTLVLNRVLDYAKTNARHEYEFEGDPVDPWKLFGKQGFSTSLSLPQKSNLILRKLDFAPGKIRTIRQVLDRRVAKSDSGSEAAVWVRDVYTDHYFDSWGEWTYLSCGSGKSKSALLVQVLMVEFDLLKKNDVLSKMMRGKMRSAFQENGSIYLDRAAKRLLGQK